MSERFYFGQTEGDVTVRKKGSWRPVQKPLRLSNTPGRRDNAPPVRAHADPNDAIGSRS